MVFVFKMKYNLHPKDFKWWWLTNGNAFYLRCERNQDACHHNIGKTSFKMIPSWSRVPAQKVFFLSMAFMVLRYFVYQTNSNEKSSDSEEHKHEPRIFVTMGMIK